MASINPTLENKTQNILIISQNEEMLNMWVAFFKEKNYYVISEKEIKSGIQTSRLIIPALIIIDLNLPQNEGIEFCKALRATTNGALIMLAPRNTDSPAYYQAGIDEFISTPANPMAVLIKSISLLARQEWLIARKQTAHMHR